MQSIGGELIKVGSFNFTTVTTDIRKPHIVYEYHNDVRTIVISYKESLQFIEESMQ